MTQLNSQISEIDLRPDHPIIKAAAAMVDARQKHSDMQPTLDEVGKKFPLVSRRNLVLLWIGVDAADTQKS